MIWFGLAMTVAFVPGWTGAAIPTGWAVASCVLPLALWRRVRLTPFHWALGLTLAYACLSTLWSLSDNNVIGLWKFFIFALAFWLGSSLPSLRSLLRGFAIGLIISTAVAVAQAFGFDFTLHADAGAGLQYNGIIQGLMIGTVIVGLVIEHDWWFIPVLLPGLYLADSRGGWLVLAIGLSAIWFRRPLWIILGAAIGAVAIAASGLHPGSDSMRFGIWRAALAHMAWFGNGPESFLNLFMQWPGRGIIQPEYVHNDYIQLVFEYGLGAIPILLVFIALVGLVANRYWPMYICFAAAACFVFPLHMAPGSVLFGAIAGHVAGDWHMAWPIFNRSRRTLPSRHDLEQAALA